MTSRNFTPEQTLIDRLTQDDAAAFEELSRRYCYSLYTYCNNKLNSQEDSRRIVRNIFIGLWEIRCDIPHDFSLSLYLYTEVRKAVIQCINVKLNQSKDIPVIEELIIPGFRAIQLRKAKEPVKNNRGKKSDNHSSALNMNRYEEQWWNKYTPVVNLRDLRQTFKTMLNAW